MSANTACPFCGFPIRPMQHASIGSVAFCRTACVLAWCAEHGLTLTPRRADRRRFDRDTPDRRAS